MSSRMQPLISIVIANYNYGRFLETAIQSVLQQCDTEMRLPSGDGIELIIVDGGSTDNSVEIIQAFSDRLGGVRFWESTEVGEAVTANGANVANENNFRTLELQNSRTRFLWCSEKDRGQSDAFNKGFSHAQGQIGCWLNADDVLLPGTLLAVSNQVKASPDTEWITGGTIFTDANLRVWRARIGTGLTNGMYAWVDPTVIGGPSAFFSLRRLREVGGFNVDLHYAMDGDLWNKFFAAGMKTVHINRYFWGFRVHEMSKTSHSLTGQRSDAFAAEDAKVFTRRNFSATQLRRAAMKLKFVKLINGSALRSTFDTIRMRGKTI